MASAIMHIAVADKVNKFLNMEDKMLFLGTIAPDISKQVGTSRDLSHFIDNTDGIPNVNKFYNKYKDYLNNPFEMGYYIHILTDYYWFKEFIPKRIKNLKITDENGNMVVPDSKEISKLIYNDYTNLNVSLIEHYDLSLKLFYEEMEYPRTRINEIPIDKLKVIVDQMGIIIKESTNGKTFIMELDDIYKFIDETADEIISIIKDERKV